MPKKIDVLNRKQYGAVSAMLTVRDVKAAMSFYQKALGFKSRGLMKGPDGQPMHAELRLRDTTVMLGPESPGRNMKGPKSLGGTPCTLYLYVDNVDKTYAKAVKLGATALMPPIDQFWGDRAGILADPEGHVWMVASHQADLTPAQMNKKMKEQMAHMAQAQSGGGS
jgi:PhnB protein